MTIQRERTSRICFGVLLAVGIGFLFLGLVVVPILPHFQLDVVLSRSEVADRQRRDATLEMLKKAAGNQWLFWTVGGFVVTVTSAVGLRAALASEGGETEHIPSRNAGKSKSDPFDDL